MTFPPGQRPICHTCFRSNEYMCVCVCVCVCVCGGSAYEISEEKSSCRSGVSSMLFPGAMAFLLKIVRVLSGVGYPASAASEDVERFQDDRQGGDSKPDPPLPGDAAQESNQRENVLFRAKSSYGDTGLRIRSPRSFCVAGSGARLLVDCVSTVCMQCCIPS